MTAGVKLPHEGVLERKSIRVFRLVSIDLILAHAEEIGEALLPGVREGRITVNPVSGSLWLELTKRAGGRFPGDAKAAISIAKAFLDDARRRLYGSRSLSAAGLAKLIPEELAFVETKVVQGFDDESNVVCIFAPRFRPDSASELCAVLGATLEIWVGAGNQITALYSNCRVVKGDEIVRAIALEKNLGQEGKTHSHGDEDDSIGPALFYVMEDENIPQTVVLPFWIKWSGHNAAITPASVLSIVATISSDGENMFADVTGGSGDYIFQWAGWSPCDNRLQVNSLGSGSSIIRPVGVSEVFLKVTDRVSNLSVFVSQNVVVHGSA